mgnify:CR=1 FL=1
MHPSLPNDLPFRVFGTPQNLTNRGGVEFGGVLLQLTQVFLISLCGSLYGSLALHAQTSLISKNNTDENSFTISANAKDLGFDLEKLSLVDEAFSKNLKSGKLIGCSALVLKSGKEVAYGQWGYQNQRRGKQIRRDTIFRIYSMSKPITSIAAMQLVERGALNLDAPITDYLPEFKDLVVRDEESNDGISPLNRPMTTRDLMRHTSGLTYGFFGNTPIDQAYQDKGILVTDSSLEVTIKKLSDIPLLHQPGETFHYSVSTDVLGRVIEVVSQMGFDDYLRKNIFDPLKMNDTFFSVPKEKLDRFALLYTAKQGNKLRPASHLQSVRFYDPDNSFFSGGGGLCSTLDDYAIFCEMLLNRGNYNGVEIIKANTVDEVFSNQLESLPKSGQFKFGLGFRIFPQGDYGWGGAAGTRFWVNPEKELTIIFMTQIMPYGNRKLGESLRAKVYDAIQ